MNIHMLMLKFFCKQKKDDYFIHRIAKYVKWDAVGKKNEVWEKYSHLLQICRSKTGEAPLFAGKISFTWDNGS